MNTSFGAIILGQLFGGLSPEGFGIRVIEIGGSGSGRQTCIGDTTGIEKDINGILDTLIDPEVTNEQILQKITDIEAALSKLIDGKTIESVGACEGCTQWFSQVTDLMRVLRSRIAK